MFFRREKSRTSTFDEKLKMLELAGFTVQRAASTAVVRDGCAAVIEDSGGGSARIARAGWLLAREIAELVDLGYQKVWETSNGLREPATADQLETLHRFLEDLREPLGLTSLYNESLGTVNDNHRYDRVSGR